jgi:hypothetical protein
MMSPTRTRERGSVIGIVGRCAKLLTSCREIRCGIVERNEVVGTCLIVLEGHAVNSWYVDLLFRFT